jgi:protein-tyrosine phosphatase
MIDLHVHPLPGLDDGPATPDDAVALVRAAAAAGTPVLVATPHVDHRWGVDPAAIGGAVERLNARLRAECVAAEVLPGAEVAVTRLLELRPDALAAARLGRGPYLLVESPHSAATGDFDAVLLRRLTAGERIVLAHPERCPAFQREPDRLARLVDAGALTSVTAGAMAGWLGRALRDFTVELLARGLVHSVASDAHDEQRRPPGLLAGIHGVERELPEIFALAEWLTEQVPRAILAGEEIPPRPVQPRRRRRRAGSQHQKTAQLASTR